MRGWTLESFEHNNRKLNNYLRNIDSAIILLCANDRSAMVTLQEMLQNEFAFEGIDYAGVRQSFPTLLKIYEDKKEQNKLCFYNMLEENRDYDLIKTINLSRDILRKVGVVVFIIPTFIMEKIQLENPNLYDYVTLSLDYNIIYDNHLEPIYSEEKRYFVPKKVRTARKAMVLTNMPARIQTVRDYYNYLEAGQYVNVKQEDVYYMMNWLFDYLHESLEARKWEMENLTDENPEDFSEIRIDLYMKTAMFFLQHGFLNEAINLYDEVLHLKKIKQTGLLSDKTSILELEAIQGKAYCYYKRKDYQRAQDTLIILKREVELTGNLAWRYKIYNDLGVCYLKQNRVYDAIAIWKECELGLRQMGEYNTYRHFRILYNMMLVSLDERNIFPKREDEWAALEKEICHNIGENGLEYFGYLLMSSWIYFKDGRLDIALDYAIKACQAGDIILPDNNEKRIWGDYILALIALQRGEIKDHQYFLTRCGNLLKNHQELISDYRDLFL